MRCFFVSLLLGSWCVCAAAQMTTQQNDNSRTGQNTSENILTPANVNPTQFGKLISKNVDGPIAAQPLYLPPMALPDGTTRSLIFVATMHDSVYAFGAVGGALLWHKSLIPPGASSVSTAGENCNFTEILENGILGTPVIDAAANTLFVVAKTLESGQPVFRIHALDIRTGVDILPSVVISGSVPTTTGTATFAAGTLHQRPGLLLVNGTVYVAFGSNGCDLHANGWVMGYNENTLEQTAIWGTDADQSFGASIWQSGKGLAADAAGNLFFATANGLLNTSTGDYGDSILRMSSSLQLEDYFAPYLQSTLQEDDLDLGSGGVILLPDQPGLFPHLLVAAGKEGTVYLLNRDNLGQFNPSKDVVMQTIPGGLPGVRGGGTGAAYWNGNIYYETSSGLRMFTLSNGQLVPVTIPPTSASNSGKGHPSVSSNGTKNGIVWLMRGTADVPILTAYTAANMTMIYDSTMAANGRDTVAAMAHFFTPTIARGRVYVGTQSQLLIFGLLSKLAAQSGNNQTGQRGTRLTLPLQVLATNSTGAPLQSVTINFSDNGAGGSFSSPSTTTNSAGSAVTLYTLPFKPGPVTITASSNGVTSVQFTETAQ